MEHIEEDDKGSECSNSLSSAFLSHERVPQTSQKDLIMVNPITFFFFFMHLVKLSKMLLLGHKTKVCLLVNNLSFLDGFLINPLSSFVTNC